MPDMIDREWIKTAIRCGLEPDENGRVDLKGVLLQIDGAPSAGAGWISVKSKLPPRELNVLAVNGHGRIKILAFWKKDGERWTWIENLRFTHWNDITHWMPLPEPPKEDE